MERLAMVATEYDLVKFAIKEALKREGEYTLTICKEGIFISKYGLYNSKVPVEDVVLSKAERNFIMKCFDEGVNIAYDTIVSASVMAAGKKRTPRQLVKKDFDAVREHIKHLEQIDGRASAEKNDVATAPNCGAFTTSKDGSAFVCMLINLTEDTAKADIEKGLDVYAINIADAETLFGIPVRHNKGADNTDVPYVHENNPPHQVGDPHAFYKKITVWRCRGNGQKPRKQRDSPYA